MTKREKCTKNRDSGNVESDYVERIALALRLRSRFSLPSCATYSIQYYVWEQVNIESKR